MLQVDRKEKTGGGTEALQELNQATSCVLCLTDGLCVAATLCGVSMWRVDWEEEAVQARKQSIAMQAERLLQGSSCDVTDVESSLDGVPQGSRLPAGRPAVGPPDLVHVCCRCRTM